MAERGRKIIKKYVGTATENLLKAVAEGGR